jgi:carboxypeptidase PM20D1
MKKLLKVALALVGVAVAVGAIRALRITTTQVPPGPASKIAIASRQAADRLAGALRLPTISTVDPAQRDGVAFLALHDYLVARFPRVTAALTREVVAGYSLLYTWPGSAGPNPGSPGGLIIAAHLDVVPANADLGRWMHPPFAGVVDETVVWGRGALDNKSSMLGTLEAVEALLAAGFTPRQTIYLAFGHNEEGGGDASGAAAIAATLAARGVRQAALLDEGGIIYDKMIGVRQPVALVGIGEKGVLTLMLTVESAGGHSSMPPPESAIGILARAVDRVERSPMPARFDGALRETFRALAPEMTWPMRAAFSNLWLTRPLLMRQLAAQPTTNALIRTTTAPTMLMAGEKSNVLASSARAVVNFRLLPGDTIVGVIAHLTKTIADPRVRVEPMPDAQWEAPPLSGADTPAFRTLAASILAVYPEVIVAPFLTVGATDARHYRAVAPAPYRFLPVHQAGAIESIHGINENIRIDVYERMIRFYATLIVLSSA